MYDTFCLTISPSKAICWLVGVFISVISVRLQLLHLSDYFIPDTISVIIRLLVCCNLLLKYSV